MKYFFASVVGMLRDKTSDLAELNALVGSGIKERWELLQQRRLDEQEDVLYRLREVSQGPIFCCCTNKKLLLSLL